MIYTFSYTIIELIETSPAHELTQSNQLIDSIHSSNRFVALAAGHW